MIQRVVTQEFLFILDTETEWDGVGYPTEAKKVWQCRLDNAQELPLYEAKHLELQAEFDRQQEERAEAEAKAEQERIDSELKAKLEAEKAEADRLAKISNL